MTQRPYGMALPSQETPGEWARSVGCPVGPGAARPFQAFAYRFRIGLVPQSFPESQPRLPPKPKVIAADIGCTRATQLHLREAGGIRWAQRRRSARPIRDVIPSLR